MGKRNYAMILLSTRLCMRGSDIVNLEFSNINWDDGYITFMQVKTGIPQSLPIQEEVGIALIDYIKNARPLCNTRKLFITARAPIRPMTSSGYTAIVARAISHAGINTEPAPSWFSHLATQYCYRHDE
ncbi:tyrosine-type recombinase/integrase [Bacteroides thetaiotaomicron]|nr:tyrosine-type recombinase/integrase [Bacteroides thetaiotaomicron]